VSAESDANRDFTISRRGELLKIMREIQPPGKMWVSSGTGKERRTCGTEEIRSHF
jgi:hypothetical protein